MLCSWAYSPGLTGNNEANIGVSGLKMDIDVRNVNFKGPTLTGKTLQNDILNGGHPSCHHGILLLLS
jgi:hypothetical protein